MACQLCSGAIFKEKLGRCKQCMQLNLVLLLCALSLYWGCDLSAWQAVQRVALLMFLGAVALLMSAHIIAWCFYRLSKRRV